jgi:ABC-2 type transport system ATP-binding protein
LVQEVAAGMGEEMSGSAAIEAQRLHRVYRTRSRLFGRRREIVAVEEISFRVPRGQIFGMLGPNGAGKTTTIKMLSTLLVPTSGRATVGGYDVVRQERMVRRQLGVVLGGDRGLYAKLSARDNLRYFGNLYGMRGDAIARRSQEMLQLVGLEERAGDRVEGFSRGMKQRLHLAKALLHDPPVLVLDEPTIGLDPAAALDLRRAIAALAPAHTVLLTTHDMTEADALCAEIAIVDQGRIVAQGTPDELKARVAGTRRVIIATEAALDGQAKEIDDRMTALPGVREVERQMEGGGTAWVVLCSDTGTALDGALAILRERRAPIAGVRVVEPTLEDVFLETTGKSFE